MRAATTFVHTLRAALALHSMVTLFHHHLMPAFGLTGTSMMCHPADAAPDKADEKDESDNDKEPGDKREEFAGQLFFEFCKQQRTRKN